MIDTVDMEIVAIMLV